MVSSKISSEPSLPPRSVPLQALPEERKLSKIQDYFRPRPSTGGDQEYSSPFSAGLGGGIQGLLVGGIQGAAGGAAGGVIGTRMGEETESMKNALATGTLSGAGTTLIAASLLSVLMGSPSGVAAYLLTMGIIGGAAGAAGSLTSIFKEDQHREALKENVRNLFHEKSTGDNNSAASKSPPAADETAPGKIRRAMQSFLKKTGYKILATLTGAAIGAAAGAFGGPVATGIASLTGAVTGFAGAKIADNIKSVGTPNTLKAVSRGVGLSTALTASTAALIGIGGITLATGSPALGMALLGGAMTGALSGTVGTLSGSRLGGIRDSSRGGFIAGILARAFSGAGTPLAPLAGSIGGAIASRATKPFGKVVLSALTGGAIGALTGITAGPIGAAIGAIIGGGTAVVGALGGPKLFQGLRNLGEDIHKKASGVTDKLADTLVGVLGRKNGVITAGFVSGAITSLPLGIMAACLAGPAGLAITSAAAGVIKGYKLHQTLKDMDNIKMVHQELTEHGPTMDDLNEQMFAMAHPSMEQHLNSLTDEARQQYISSFKENSYQELQKTAALIEKIKEGLSPIVYNEVKKDLKAIKKEDKQKEFLAEKIIESKASLAQIIVTELVAAMSAREAAPAA